MNGQTNEQMNNAMNDRLEATTTLTVGPVMVWFPRASKSTGDLELAEALVNKERQGDFFTSP